MTVIQTPYIFRDSYGGERERGWNGDGRRRRWCYRKCRVLLVAVSVAVEKAWKQQLVHHAKAWKWTLVSGWFNIPPDSIRRNILRRNHLSRLDPEKDLETKRNRQQKEM